MKFAAYIPQKSENEQLPVLIWLSGLTCNLNLKILNWINYNNFLKAMNKIL